MQSNLAKNLKKIFTAFNKLHKLPKALVKYGGLVFFAVFMAGTVLVLLNNTILTYNAYFDFVSKSIVKTSFSLAAEVVIGALVMDFIINR